MWAGADHDERVPGATTKLDPNVQHHPSVIASAERRAADVQLRIADRITAFAGSMKFVYLHAVLFAVWMLLIERNPWRKLPLKN